MKKSEWSDYELEELLRQMPKIQDYRNPRDIYQNLSLKKRKPLTRLLPGIAAAAALLLFFILGPKLLDGQQFSSNQAGDEKSSGSQSMKLADKSDKSEKSSQVLMAKDSSSKERTSMDTGKAELLKTNSTKTALYADEVGDGTVLTYWIPDQQAEILVPVSTVVSNPEEKSWLSLYSEKMGELKEEEWGLSDFYPLNAQLKLDPTETSVIVDVPASHQYGQGAAMETNFINILQKDIASNSNLKKIMFTTNGEPGIELGNFGRKEELIIENEKNHAYFFYYPAGSAIPFLTPASERYSDFGTALEAMRNDQHEFNLKSSLLPSMQIQDVSINDNILYVSMKDNPDLNDNQLTLCSFEAMLLTAKEFGIEKVIVKNPPLTNIGPFDLSKEILVPIAPNLRTLP